MSPTQYFEPYAVTFVFEPEAPYTAEDAGVRIAVMTSRWHRLDEAYDRMAQRMEYLTNQPTTQIAKDATWPAQVARVHARLARLQAEMDAEALNATERVYLGPRLSDGLGSWTFANPTALRKYLRRMQAPITPALRESLVVPMNGEG